MSYMSMKVTGLAASILVGTVAMASATTFQGKFWDVDVGGGTGIPGLTSQTAGNPENDIVDNLADALAIIGYRSADATFNSTTIDYPQGGGADSTSTSATLGAFLGTDAASLSSSILNIEDTPMLGSVFEFTGIINLLAGNNVFSVASDDGFLLEVGGTEVGRFEGTRAISSASTFNFDAGAGGQQSVRLVFFEDQNVQVGVRVTLNDELLSAVPLPAAGFMLLVGLAGLGAVARRKVKSA